jgi:hypothetical protein
LSFITTHHHILVIEGIGDRMNDQLWNQFVNEQSLINMSILEQLNEQAQYLNSIVERLDIIYQFIKTEKPIKHMETKTMNIDKSAMNIDTSKINIDTSKAKGVRIGFPKEEEVSQEPVIEKQEDVTPKPVEGSEMTEITIQETDNITKVSYEIQNTILFGDRIQVITKKTDKTGVFIEIDDRFLVWVMDEGRLTFTDLRGTTIIKLT